MIIATFLLAQLPSLHSGAHSFLPDQNLMSKSDQSFVDFCKMPPLQIGMGIVKVLTVLLLLSILLIDPVL